MPVGRLAEEHEWAHWISIMLAVLHEAPFVAIEPSSGRGIAERLSGTSEPAPGTCTYRGLRRRGAARDARTEHWIWNEGLPAEIPELDGTRVIPLEEPAYERSWNAVRTFAELRASLDARALDDHETRGWLDAIRAAASS